MSENEKPDEQSNSNSDRSARSNGRRPHRHNDSKPQGSRGRGPRRGDKPGGDRRESGRSDRPNRGNRNRDGQPRESREGYRPRRDGDRENRGFRDGDRGGSKGGKNFGRGGTRGGGRSDRGGAGREFTELERLQHSLRPVREQHIDPPLDKDVTPEELDFGARNELKTLEPKLADIVAMHLAMVVRNIDYDPEVANQHAISAMRRAGRIPVTRETYAYTSYRLGDYATALRELRTFRRLSGRNTGLALEIDCERGLGRPERGIELGNKSNIKGLPVDQRVQVAIALSGARLDLGQPLQALYELEIPELNPKKAFTWSPELFAAYSAVLEDLGRFEESKTWHQRALQAEAAIEAAYNPEHSKTQEVYEEILEDPEAIEADAGHDPRPDGAKNFE